jgi:4-methylaminobutanoate oxidase (formaldehyde-forming)
MVADVTVTRLGDDHFRVVTGAGFVASDLAWLRWQREPGDDVTIRDVSGDLATIGLWGPRARDVLAAAVGAGVAVDDAALPPRVAREITVASARVLAARISYAGELGWELTTDAASAVLVWDALVAHGEEHALAPFGYRALDGLRMEKGYRYFGTDMTMLDTPFEAGLGMFVRLDREPFVGRDALIAARRTEQASPDAARRLRTIMIGDDVSWLPVYGGEAVRRDGVVIGRVRSAAYGPTVARTIGYVYGGADLGEGARLTVDAFDSHVPATVVPDVLWDPAGDRMRG